MCWCSGPNNSSEDSHTVTVHVLPGQRTCGVVVEEARQANPKVRKSPGVQSEGGTSVVWAAGTVRDESGSPLSGIKVLLLPNFSGDENSHEKVISTLTDAKGAWQFRSPANLNLLNGIVVAHKSGRPYAGAVLTDPSCDNAGGCESIAGRYDLVLPARGGSIQATILEQGKPLKGVFVGLERECPLTVNQKFSLRSRPRPRSRYSCRAVETDRDHRRRGHCPLHRSDPRRVSPGGGRRRQAATG